MCVYLSLSLSIYIYIYIYIYRGGGLRPISALSFWISEGLTQSYNITLRGGTIMSIGDFLESLSQAILEGRFLAGRLGVTFEQPKLAGKRRTQHSCARLRTPLYTMHLRV